MSVLEDVKLFLWRHPWATSEVDNPVDLLSELRDQVDELEIEISALRGVESALRDAKAEIREMREANERMTAAVKRFREQLKIGEAEIENALKPKGKIK